MHKHMHSPTLQLQSGSYSSVFFSSVLFSREPPLPPPTRRQLDAAAALSGVFPHRVHVPSVHLFPPSVWCISRRQRNRLQHALNGNPPPASRGWQTAGRRRAEQVPGADVRRLSELQPVSRLRAEGWEIPPSVEDSALLRVYDMRLDHQWLGRLQQALALGTATEDTFLIGGDFLHRTALRDEEVVLRTRRWGPASSAGSYHVFVVPRPHQEEWVRRAHQQVGIEDPDCWVSVALVVPRDKLPETLTLKVVREAVPALRAVLDDATLEVVVSAVGERPVLQRVPAGCRLLPPEEWESAHLAINRVLVVASFRRRVGVGLGAGTSVAGTGTRPAPVTRWVLGTPPRPAPSPLELLRVQLALPPAVKQANADKMLRAAVRKSAGRLHLTMPPAGQLRQVQASEGSVFALLGVPKAEARQWLRSSGAGGLLVRPFWVSDGSSSLKRSDYEICWLKSCTADAATLWEALSEQYGFFGLVTNGRTLGLRVLPGVDVDGMLAQVHFATKDVTASIHRPVFGARWWQVGPLTDAEAWRATEVVAAFGLQPLRGELRFGRSGPFRSVVYFTAVGEPHRYSLDDGSWAASAAKLSPAAPPPQRPRKPLGPALSPQSTWAGPRTTSPPNTAPMGPLGPAHGTSPSNLCPVSAAVGIIPYSAPPVPTRSSAHPETAGPPSLHPMPAVGPPLAVWPQPAPTPTAAGHRDSDWRPGGQGLGTPGSVHDVAEQLAALVAQIGALSAEVRELRMENQQLRQQLVAVQGAHQPQPYQHQPYLATSPPRPLTPLCPIPMPRFSSVPASPGDTAMETSALGLRERERGTTPDAKRVSGAARTLVLEDTAAEPPPAAGRLAMDMASTLCPLQPEEQRAQPEAPTNYVL